MQYRDDDERRALTPDDPIGAVLDRLLYPASFAAPLPILLDQDVGAVEMIDLESRRSSWVRAGRHAATESLLCYRSEMRETARTLANLAAQMDPLWAPLAELIAREVEASWSAAARQRGTIPKRGHRGIRR